MIPFLSGIRVDNPTAFAAKNLISVKSIFGYTAVYEKSYVSQSLSLASF
jgi:hypothetical protein